MNVPVCYAAPFCDASGYGEASRNAILALREGGADIKTQKISFTQGVNYDTPAVKIAEELSQRDLSYKIKIIHTTPDVYKNYKEPGKYHIGHLFWETDKIPESWVLACNSMQEIWTGTDLNRQTLERSGVKVPICVIPQSVDIDIPESRAYKLPNFKGIVFYSIFEWIERKDPKTLVHAYWKEFKGQNDVALLIKTHKSSYSEIGLGQILQEVRMWRDSLGWKDTPRLFLQTDNLTKDEMHRLHETGDVYVTTSRGEGWNLPLIEACLHKKPVISPKYGGVCEYLAARHYYRVEHDIVSIDKVYGKYYTPGMNWAQAKEEDLRATMRKVYDCLVDDKKKMVPGIRSGSARNLVRLLFNYSVVGAQMHNRLIDIQNEL